MNKNYYSQKISNAPATIKAALDIGSMKERTKTKIIWEQLFNPVLKKNYVYMDSIVFGNLNEFNQKLSQHLNGEVLILSNKSLSDEYDGVLGVFKKNEEFIVKSQNEKLQSASYFIDLSKLNIKQSRFDEKYGYWILSGSYNEDGYQESHFSARKISSIFKENGKIVFPTKKMEEVFLICKELHYTSLFPNVPYLRMESDGENTMISSKHPAIKLWAGAKIITPSYQKLLETIITDYKNILQFKNKN